MKTSALIWPVVASTLISCGKTSSSNYANVPASFRFTGSASASTLAMTKIEKILDFILPSAQALTPPTLTDSTSRSVVLNSAWVSIEQIELVSGPSPEPSEIDGSEISFNGPYYVDLLSTNPALLDTQNVAAKSVQRIKIKLHQTGQLPSSAPSGLGGNSIYISGTVNGAAFTYSSKDGSEINIGGSKPIIPSSGQDLLVVIRMASLFKKIDFSAVSAGTNISETNRVSSSCPLIDASASDIYTCIRKGIESQSNFGKDDNGDHDLDTRDETVR